MRIATNQLTKRYRRGAIALDHLDLRVPGGMFGLLGANGAGKTTLMRVLAGIIAPTSGTATVDGIPLDSTRNRRTVQRELGYLPQELGVYPDLTARRFLDYIAILKGVHNSALRRRSVDRLLETVALTGQADRRIGTFSGGMKRRIGIAQALLGEPRLLIVDEPTAGLDPTERIRFRNLLTDLARDRTVLLSTHIVEDIASTCPRLAVMDRGRILHTGDTASLVAAARGRTWVVDLPHRGSPPAGATVVASVDHGDHVTARVITDGEPPAGARPAEPTLEDGYLAITIDAPPRVGSRP
ncbi:ABC transporter ATP-binding protein [Actinoplanes subtropicus]|uniref:ABC transporter ATP-binding protein n=1 Tax=Actinoplanes subtropicus TaxID=543632 RepID=UPI0004C2D30F|nr:ABC transporter ATP-binding protein [Actinoplanes subtropicus]